MKVKYKYPNPIYSTQLMLMEKRNQRGRTPSFDYCLFRMNCYLMELSQINVLGNVL